MLGCELQHLNLDGILPGMTVALVGMPHTSIQGHSPSNLTRTGRWNGESTYNPRTRKLFQTATVIRQIRKRILT